jgi:hypothetical protein
MAPRHFKPPKTVPLGDLLELMAMGDQVRAATHVLIDRMKAAGLRQSVLRNELRDRLAATSPAALAKSPA